MSAPYPAPAAARLRRPTWRDPRLIVGLVLVLACVALGARVLSAADRTVPVWAAAQTLAVGTPLARDHLSVTRVRADDALARYLSAASEPGAELVITRPVGEGELVPVTAVGPADLLDQRPVVVPLTPPLAAGLRPGARAEIWVSRRAADGAAAGAYAEPELLVRAADIRAVTAAEGALATSTPTGVEVMLDARDLPAVLDALANKATVALVPVPGSAPSGGDDR